METIKISNCEGYLWWSDQQKPEVYDGKALTVDLDDAKNPFVVEGQLFDKDANISYSVKYVDGRYLIKTYKVEKQDPTNPNNDTKTYLANRMGDRRLTFLRYWEEKEDENCMDMPVLTLTKNVFIGFEK